MGGAAGSPPKPDIQGVRRLLSQLWQLISLSNVDIIKYPFNHLIIYRGDFVWHIECIHTWPDAFEIAWGYFCWFSGFFKIFDPYLKFCDHFGVSWQNMASGEGHWFITPLFKWNSPLFELCFTSFCSEPQIGTLWVTQLIQFYRILSKTVSILNSWTNKGIMMFHMSNKIPHIDD